ncbi:unnamed protein product, partial [Mesorhabditis spiculigera]
MRLVRHFAKIYALLVGIQEFDPEIVAAVLNSDHQSASDLDSSHPALPESYRKLVKRGLADTDSFYSFVEQQQRGRERLEKLLSDIIEAEEPTKSVALPVLLVSEVFTRRYGMK